jgi:hypothetical protein
MAGVVGGVSATTDHAEPRVRPRRFRDLPTTELAGRAVPVASTWRSRLLGLALLSAERAGDGLLIPRCRSVHTFGMRFPIHVVFLDRRGVPVSVRGAVPPNRFLRERRAAAAVELPVPRATPAAPNGGCR